MDVCRTVCGNPCAVFDQHAAFDEESEQDSPGGGAEKQGIVTRKMAGKQFESFFRLSEVFIPDKMKATCSTACKK